MADVITFVPEASLYSRRRRFPDFQVWWMLGDTAANPQISLDTPIYDRRLRHPSYGVGWMTEDAPATLNYPVTVLLDTPVYNNVPRVPTTVTWWQIVNAAPPRLQAPTLPDIETFYNAKWGKNRYLNAYQGWTNATTPVNLPVYNLSLTYDNPVTRIIKKYDFSGWLQEPFPAGNPNLSIAIFGQRLSTALGVISTTTIQSASVSLTGLGLNLRQGIVSPSIPVFPVSGNKCYCNVCGFIRPCAELKRRWDGVLTCSDCWEPRQPQDFVRGVVDKQLVPDSNAEPQDVFLNPGDVKKTDL